MQPVYSVSYEITNLRPCSCGVAKINAQIDTLCKKQFEEALNMFNEIMKDLGDLALYASEIQVRPIKGENKMSHTISIYIPNKQYLDSMKREVTVSNDQEIIEMTKKKINSKINQ